MEKTYKVVSLNDDRFIIVDSENVLVDDAQGYGYKTAQKAYKALAYKFKGGKDKNLKIKSDFKEWINIGDNKSLFKKLQIDMENILFNSWKDNDKISYIEVIKLFEKKNNLVLPDFVKRMAIKFIK